MQTQLIQGGRHNDARGAVSFVNGFDFKGVDRFYWIVPWSAGSRRGWVGHQRDHKWFTVVRGDMLISVVRPDNWQAPQPDLAVQRFSLAAATPQVLHVPPGHATAIVSLSDESILMVFSSGKLEDATTDDFRFPIDQWPARA